MTTPAPPEIVNNRSFFGHPRGLGTLFFVEMWERFSYYGVRPLLILFMTATMMDGGFGFDRPKAAAIVGMYAFGVYVATLPGGWVADRWLGLQRSIWYGGIIIASGHLSIGLSKFLGQSFFFIGLVLIVIGTGLLKPNISAIVGDLYPEGGARRDAGFSIYYMGINLGAFLAPLIAGLLFERFDPHLGFGSAGIGMFFGLITFRMFAKSTLGPIGTGVTGTAESQRKARNITLGAAAVIALIVAMALAGAIPIDPVPVARNTTNVVLGLLLLYFGYLFFFAGLTTDEKKRVAVIVVLFFFAVVFWSAFEQAPTSLNLFARDFTDRNLFGWEVPTTWLQAVNSLFVILLAPVFAAIWLALGKRGRNPSSPTKFAFGLFCAGLGFYIMVIAANAVISGGAGTKVSMMWLTVSYLLQTIGELSLSPVGLSSMTKLAPQRFAGQMMGIWFMASALGNLIAGLVGGNIDPEKLEEMPKLFQQTAWSLFIATAVLALLVPLIRRMMRDSSVAASH